MDLSTMAIGDSAEIGVGDWDKSTAKTAWDAVTEYAAKNWPVQFEVSTAWRPTERGIEQPYYTVTRIR